MELTSLKQALEEAGAEAYCFATKRKVKAGDHDHCSIELNVDKKI